MTTLSAPTLRSYNMNQPKLKICIIGGVAGGAAAATKARRENEHADIFLFERGPYISFSNCGLPYYIGGQVDSRDKLFVTDPERMWQRYRIQAKPFHEVLSINRKMKAIQVRDWQNDKTLEFAYDKLILAPGAGAIVPNFPGVQKAKNVFCVKTVPDTDKIKTWLSEHKNQNAVVVGAGFIGLESAESLMRVLPEGKVTIVEKMDQVLPPFDKDMADLVGMHLEHSGIQLVLGDGISALNVDETTGKAHEIVLESGKKLPCDLIILSIGVRPELKLAQEAGLAIGEKTGGIVVNEFQQSITDPDVYAAGDAVQVKNIVTGEWTRIALAGIASKQGRAAGANAAAGNHIKFPGALGSCILETMGITAGMTGLTEKQCQKAGFDYDVSIVHPFSHLDIYPGAKMLHIKLIAQKKTGRILGCQIVGEDGVDKRVDVLATAISAKMSVHDVADLDLCYSPQFSSAKDPIIIAAYAMDHAVQDEVRLITAEKLRTILKSSPPGQCQCIDVRTPRELKGDGALEGFINSPVDQLRDDLHRFDKEKPTYVLCRSGLRSYLATRILMQNGFKNVYNITGGFLVAQKHLSKL